MSQTNPSEAAAASSPFTTDRLRTIEAKPFTVTHGDTAAMAREILRMREEAKHQQWAAKQHVERLPDGLFGGPLGNTVDEAVGKLVDCIRNLAAGLGREAKALLEASFMLRCADGGHPMPSPRVEETFGIFEALRKLCDERDTAMHEADAWKRKADTLGADLNRIRALVPTASDEQTTFDAVRAELRRLRGESLGDALNFGLKMPPALPAEAQTAIAAMRDVGPELAKAGVPVGMCVGGGTRPLSHAEAVAQLRDERDQWREKFEAVDREAAEAARWGINTIKLLADAGFLPRAPKEAGVHEAVVAALAELNRLRNESKRDRAEKQQALLDQIAQLLPGKGDLLGRVQKGAALAKIGAEASNDGWRERFMRLRDSIKVQLAWCSTPSGTPHPGMLAEHRVLSCALKNAEAMLREASGDLASLPSLPAKEGPLPGSFCGTNQPEMPPLKADAPCGYKPASHRDDFDNAPNFGGKFAPATGQPRAEAPLAADGSGTVVELGEAFRQQMNAATVYVDMGDRIHALHRAVGELAKVVERMGVRS